MGTPIWTLIRSSVALLPLLVAACGGGPEAGAENEPDFEFAPFLTVDASGPDGSSVRAVALVGNELITLSDRVVRWSLDTGEPIEGGGEPAGFDGGERLHVSDTRGFLGFSDGGRFYSGVHKGEPLIEAKGQGYMKVSWIEGRDEFAATDGGTLQFFARANGASAGEQPISQGATLVVGAERSYASVTRDHRIVVWPIDGAVKGMVLAGHGDSIVALAYAPDERHFASADRGGVVIVWSLEDGTEQRRFQLELGRTLPVAKLDFLAGTDVIVLHGNGPDVSREVTLRSIASGEVLRTLRTGTGGVISLAVSADGKSLAVGTAFSGRHSQNRVRDELSPAKRSGLLTSGAAHVFDVSDVGR